MQNNMKGSLVQQVAMVVLTASVLTMCAKPYGSVSRESVAEAMASPRLSITPRMPRWLLHSRQLRGLNNQQRDLVCAILTPEKVRHVGEEYYRSESQGNRNDDSTLLFYLYPINGQSLGGRIIGKKVLMDDFDLSEEDTLRLYDILRPQLAELFPKDVPTTSL